MSGIGWMAGLVAATMLGQGPASTDRMPYDPKLADKSVAFWEGRAKGDPEGFLDLRDLAGAYLARQRERGDIADAVKAEAAARASLKIVLKNNTGAMTRLAQALLAQHRFPEALAIADLIARADTQAARLVVDIKLELGDYDEASRAMDAIPTESDDLNAKALRARFELVDGRTDRAIRHMREAAKLADERPDMPAEVVAWYHTMVGHMLIDSGQIDDGERACRDALAIFPRDYRALTGLAESAAWRGDHQGTIDHAAMAIDIAPQNPEALRLLAEAYRAMGKTREADDQERRLSDLAHSFARIYDRHWLLFLADNDRDLDEALALAREDMKLRHDIHAHDALGWACFKKGLLAEADRELTLAMVRGTQDATIFHHAGVIAKARGDQARPDSLLSKARTSNPYLMKAEDAKSRRDPIKPVGK